MHTRWIANVPKFETSRSKVIARLKREGWENVGGAKHDKFSHVDKPGIKITLPRHKTISIGVARQIAKAAGWM
jgi:predicted RNA binding protein YcfA (HicA-like mRNA interferase family)